MTRRRVLGGVACLLVLLGIALAGPASAHALLLATSPGIGSEVATEPAAVTLTFDEGVTGSDRAIVVTAGGRRLDDGQPVHPGGAADALSVRLRPGPLASYSVVWRVGSADGHAVDGSFSFGVGTPAGAAPSLDSVSGSRAVQVAQVVAQGLAYLGLVLGVGTALVVGALWSASAGQPRVRLLVAGGWGAEVVATIALFLVQGPVTAGTGLTTVFSGVGATFDARSGRLLLARLVLLVLLLPALRRLLSRDSGATLDLAVLGVALAVSFPLGDHASTGHDPVLAVGLGVLHVLAATMWLGGLAVLSLALLRTDGAHGSEPAGSSPAGGTVALRTWSRIAAGCVAVLVVTGVVASVREVGGWTPLHATTYGRVLLAKLVVVAVMLAVANLARRRVSRGAGPLRRGVVAEAGLGFGVLVLTAALVGTEPARDSYPAPVHLQLSLARVDGPGGPVTATVDIDRSRVGPETITVRLTDAAGRSPSLASLDGLLTDTAYEDDPLRFPFVIGTPGRGTAAVELPETGHWLLDLELRGGSGAASDASGQTSYEVS